MLASGACGVIGALITERMVTDVNAQLPVQEQFARTGWHALKTRRLWQTYRGLYPNGPLVARVRMVSTVGVIAATGLTWAAGFGPVSAGVMFAATALSSWQLLWR